MGRETILQSCNGLLLCSFAYWSGNSVLEYHIINPTTKQFFHFPTRQYKNPLKSPHYKLVCVGRAKKPSLGHRIDIYSSETRSLRPAASGSGNPLIIAAPPPGIRFRRPVYCNGAIHWLSEGKTSLYLVKPSPLILTIRHWRRFVIYCSVTNVVALP